MSDAGQTVAIVGTGVVAQQIAASLLERDFPVESLRFLAADGTPGDSVEIDERTFPVEALADPRGRLDLVFLTNETDWQELDTEGLVAAGATLIDCSGRYAREADVPLIVPECNAETLAEAPDRRIVASPDTVVVALAVVLAPLQAQAGLRRVVATSFEPVSEAGAGGIDELSRQTVDLLQGRSTDAEVFPARIAFNVLPRVGEVAPSGDSLAEEQSSWQLRRLLELSDLPIVLNRVCVPVFFGTGIALNVELETPMDAGEAGEVLRAAPGVVMTAADEEAALSVGDAVGQDATVVSRLRPDRSVDGALSLWVAIDNTRKGSAVNAVQIAELALRDL